MLFDYTPNSEDNAATDHMISNILNAAAGHMISNIAKKLLWTSSNSSTKPVWLKKKYTSISCKQMYDKCELIGETINKTAVEVTIKVISSS